MMAGMSLFENLVFGSKAYNDIERVQRISARVGLGDICMEDFMRTTKHGKPWFYHWTQTQKRKAQLIRALIFNPEILAIHKPICGVDVADAKALLLILREYVNERGLELEDLPLERRQPRTLFITAGEKNVPVQKCADIMWQLPTKKGQIVSVIVEGGAVGGAE